MSLLPPELVTPLKVMLTGLATVENELNAGTPQDSLVPQAKALLETFKKELTAAKISAEASLDIEDKGFKYIRVKLHVIYPSSEFLLLNVYSKTDLV